MKNILFFLLFLTTYSFSQRITPVNVGTSVNDRTGDPIRTAFQKLNTNDGTLDVRLDSLIEAGALDSTTAARLDSLITTGIGATWGTLIGTLSNQTDLATALSLKATVSSLTSHTGNTSNPHSVTATQVGLGNASNTSDANKPVSTAQQTALDLKANIASPTFTGTVVLPSTTSIGTITNTELSYVDGVTSSLQTQLGLKADLASPALSGTPTSPTAAGSTNSTQIATTAFVKTSSPKLYGASCSDLTTTLAAGTTKGFIPVPVGFTVTAVYAYVLTAQTSGSIITVDINEGGTTILSTKLTIDNNETSSSTAATPYVLSDTSIASHGRLTIDIDVATGGTGLVVEIEGY